MKYFAEFDDVGRVVRTLATDATIEEVIAHLSPRVIEAPPEVAPGWMKVGSEILPLPERPSGWHEFDYVAKAWALDESAIWNHVRADRDRRLSATDWVVLRAADTGQPVPPEWLAYRQALRDITEQPDPLNIEWPVAPAA